MANEKRLIDANALIAEYDRVHIGQPGGARKLMEDAPTVHAVEVVHGRWIKVYDDSAGWVDMCNKCKEFGDGTPYCPNCGATMDGGIDNDI